MNLASSIPAVSAEQMRQVDDLAEGAFHIGLIQMMENAGRSLARLARHRLMGGDVAHRHVLILAGPGGNGGGGLAAARRLHGWGATVSVVLAVPEGKLSPVPARQLRILRASSVRILESDGPLPEAHVLIDALLGYGSKGSPRPPMNELIDSANRSPAPVLSLDLPTGLDPNSGQPSTPVIEATATMTLALPKTGLFEPAAAPYVGEVWLADIGLPLALYRQLGLSVPPNLFAKDDLIRISA